MMSRKAFSFTAGLIFLVVAVAHLSRIIFRWEVIAAGWRVPVVISWVALFISGYLAYEGFRLSRSGN